MKKNKPISTGAEWTFELVERYDREIGRVAAEFGLDTYPNQIEIELVCDTLPHYINGFSS